MFGPIRAVPGPFVKLVVEDTGSGIDPDVEAYF